MTREKICLLGCLFAVDRLIEKGSSTYAIKINGNLKTILWTEVEEWLEKQFAIACGEKMYGEGADNAD